jgi:ABC-type glycerol-3-phosphate transport system substrate-binding protein
MGPGYDDWTWDAFLLAAERCHHAGVPFGLPISVCDDALGWLNPVFLAFGAALVDAEEHTTVDSDETRAALDYLRRLAAYLPDSVYSWDNASNNRALVAGGTALIVNQPSAWAQAIKDAPQVGSQCWHFPMPAGPKGRFASGNTHFWGIWSFSPNQSAAGDLIEWLSQRPQAEEICTADSGFDLPPFVSMTDFKVWTDAGPPVGTLSNYPVKSGHHATLTPSLYPAPRPLALSIYNAGILPNLVARVTKGRESADTAIAWARAELDGIRR